MAVDQRSGDDISGISNESHKLANEQGLGTTFVDALQNLEAALEHGKSNYADKTLLVWGSSYSAALLLKLAGDKPGLVDGVLAFSSGEYFVRSGWSSTWILDSVSTLRPPVFITSARAEEKDWQAIYDVIESEKVFFYLKQVVIMAQGHSGNNFMIMMLAGRQ